MVGLGSVGKKQRGDKIRDEPNIREGSELKLLFVRLLEVNKVFVCRYAAHLLWKTTLKECWV